MEAIIPSDSLLHDPPILGREQAGWFTLADQRAFDEGDFHVTELERQSLIAIYRSRAA